MIKPAARRTAALLLVPALAAAVASAERPGEARQATAGTIAGKFTAGAAGVGDPYFPEAGNGGYDVKHYDIALRYRPDGGRIAGSTRITATATQDLSRFNLDFVGNRVASVTVDGAPTSYTRAGQELQVTPAVPIANGATFKVAVTYAGSPATLDDPNLGRTGWIPTSDGAGTLSQPQGSATWFPLNDHPSDKATHAYEITVPKGLTVVANGEPGRTTKRPDTTTYRWRSASPMAGYLALLAIGKFAVRDGRTPKGVRMITAVDPAVSKDPGWLPRATGAVTDRLARLFGPYPFGSTGGVIDDEPVGYALETQNRPTYPGGADTTLVVHELAHQWFGDSVSVKRWQDIWLNEGFATYAEWLWSERNGGRPAKQHFDEAYERPADFEGWQVPTGAPGRERLFDFFPIYTRGAMTVHALRTTVGDRAFFKILKTWTAAHRGGNVSTADFIAHAEHVSGQSLRALFHAWLYTPGKPADPREPARTGNI